MDLLRHFHRFLLPLSITNPNIKIQKNEKVDLHTALCPYFRCSQRSAGKVCILFHRRRNGSQSGKWYTDDNIDQMLMERHLSKKARRSSRKCHVKGPKKRTEEDDERFAQSFEKMLLMAREKEGR